MKRSYSSKIVAAGVIAASLAVVPLTLPAYAQTNTTPETNETFNTDSSQQASNYEDDSDSNWGWLGLLGLAGLAGLARRREEPVAYRDPNAVSRSTSVR